MLGYLAQLARRMPATCSNCLVLLVTTTRPRERACPAIISSYGPIGRPARLSSAAQLAGMCRRMLVEGQDVEPGGKAFYVAQVAVDGG